MEKLFRLYQQLTTALSRLEGVGALALRLYLAPVFYVAGSNKWNGIDGTIYWFEHSLELPLPTLLAYLATLTEMGGAILLLLGLGVRFISIPLMSTMLVAAVSVHWHKGWQAVHDLSSPFTTEATAAAAERLARAKELLMEHGHYDWLTEHGNFVISNSGIEWAATYFVMCLALLFLGGGRYVSCDYWILKHFKKSYQ